MELNEHNKKEYPPMHTAEHILNQTMIRMFGCERSKNTHIERKKSKCDYFLNEAPTPVQIQEIENQVNYVISQNLAVTDAFVSTENVPESVDLTKLPDSVSKTLRLVSIGDYDVCACIGDHVKNTQEIGEFKISSSNFNEGKLRIRFKLQNSNYSD
jgi:Ser-tRNA(Ala) deacylase AlaX